MILKNLESFALHVHFICIELICQRNIRKMHSEIRALDLNKQLRTISLTIVKKHRRGSIWPAKAHRTTVSMQARGVLWPEYCLRGVSYFYYPTFNVFSLFALFSDEPEVFLP